MYAFEMMGEGGLVDSAHEARRDGQRGKEKST